MEIQPDKQNIDQTFSTTVYFIDFYQRDYKWTEEPVRRLLDDIFYQFEEAYLKHSELEANTENINARYPWYYLNTYVTNTVGGRVFVVDGQQRLTTLTLVLFKLFDMAKSMSSETQGWLERKIAGYSGTQKNFWMNHARHKQVLEGLFISKPLDEIATDTGITAVNMISNYRVISDYFDTKLTTPHLLDTFVHYFLFRLVLINLSVETNHVPMVFEVINDRGVRLKPYEILKGKLLGQIDKIELDNGKFNDLWENHVEAVNSFRDDEVDSFFRYLLKAKHANSRKSGQRFDGDYHREMFKSDINEKLRLDHNPPAVKDYLRKDFRYFTTLYAKLWQATKEENALYPAVHYNHLNELESQFMLILSACTVDDSEEDLKIKTVSQGLDRIFTLLQLQGAYDSNEFAVRLFEISSEIRDKPASVISEIFDKHLLLGIREKRGSDITEIFSMQLFKPMSVDRLNKRFTRYLFARVEKLLAEGMCLDMKHPFRELVTSRGDKNGFHIEHILSRNADNLGLFSGDEERFNQERDRLGGVLLLKGKDNISSNNEVYSEKLKSYANTLYWNETLRDDAYKSKLDFRDFMAHHHLSFRPMNSFGPLELDERQGLLFQLIKLIWTQKT